MSTARRSPSRRLLRLFLLGILASVSVTLALVLPLRWLHPLTSSFMLRNWIEQKSLSAEVHYDWVPRDRISRRAALAVLAAEDQKFFSHAGFDVESIRKVWQRNGRSRQVRGASTITQQVAKNLWLWPARSWLRKGLEAWFTVWVELLWPKERILEVYLNIAQFGPDTFGVEAAGRRYFRKPAAALNAAEAALAGGRAAESQDLQRPQPVPLRDAPSGLDPAPGGPSRRGTARGPLVGPAVTLLGCAEFRSGDAHGSGCRRNRPCAHRVRRLSACSSARARVRCKIDAPATTGHPVFERYFRVQQNTMEQLIVFIPSMWLFGFYVSPLWAAGLGLLFVLGRALYLKAYVADPSTRSAGFGLSFLPNLILLLGGLVGAILSLL